MIGNESEKRIKIPVANSQGAQDLRTLEAARTIYLFPTLALRSGPAPCGRRICHGRSFASRRNFDFSGFQILEHGSTLHYHPVFGILFGVSTASQCAVGGYNCSVLLHVPGAYRVQDHPTFSDRRDNGLRAKFSPRAHGL